MQQSTNEENNSMPLFAQWADISSNFTVSSFKTKQLDDMSNSAKNVNKICFCALFTFSNNTALFTRKPS